MMRCKKIMVYYIYPNYEYGKFFDVI